MATSESADEVEALLSMATEVVPSSMTTLQLAGLSNLEGNIVTEVSMSELRPIVMTMANMANIGDDNNVPVTSIGEVTAVEEPDNELLQISDRSETVLASHLMSTRHPAVGSPLQPQSSEVYRDSTTGVTYEIQRGGTRRGGDKLIDSLGFTYNLKAGKGNKNVSYWWCAVRNQQLRCPASVTQRGSVFMRGRRKHEHLVGQSTPKPSYNNKPKKTLIKPGRPIGSLKDRPASGLTQGSRDFKIIKNGSKAGMDLLKDCLGFTYTLKKVSTDGLRIQWRCSVRNKYVRCPATALQNGNSIVPGMLEHAHLPGANRPVIGGGVKTYWCCSVRNKHLRCPASVIQFGDNQFVQGSFDHKHLPSFNIPAAPHENIPSLRKLREQHELDDSEVDECDEEETDHSYGYSSKAPSSSSVYLNSGKVASASNSRMRMVMAREKRRRNHLTFLGPRCTINLTKCDNSDCNCRLVHCPFCDKHHFKPTKAGRVQDHLELTHFAHGVQYDDLMIVKCFHDCDPEKNYGHYHCVFCFRQMLKRTAYARHMLRHMMKMGIPDRLLVLPDSKYPDIINAYGYEIPICKKTSCNPSHQEKHYHCPNCSQVCRERSLTVNHLWRCLQKKRDGAGDGDDPDEDIFGDVDEDQLMLHVSHVKAFKDIPVEKCMRIDCCHQKYHCILCPENLFIPTYRQHLIAHYVTHWKQRVLYKNFSILKCFHPCDGIDRSMCKSRYHYHCPICRKIIMTKGTFEDHLKTCHMFRFGENLIQSKSELDKTIDEDIIMTQESAPLNENVEFMEDQLTSAAAMKAERDKLSRKKWKSLKRKGWMATRRNQKMVKEESIEDSDDDEEDIAEEVTPKKKKGPIVENDVYSRCSAVISPSLAKKVKSTGQLKSILGGVAGATSVKLSVSNRGQYLLSGPAEELLEAQRMLTKTINRELKECRSAIKAKVKGKTTPPATSVQKKMQVASLPKSEVKRGRGRPRKGDGESFPYSEIRQIIEASKDTNEDTPKRGRGRPPKKSQSKAIESPEISTKSVSSPAKQRGRPQQSEKPNPVPEVPRTPGRYGTRGVRKNYLEMNSGGYRREIKQEPISDTEEIETPKKGTILRKYLEGNKRGRPKTIKRNARQEEEEEEQEVSTEDNKEEDPDEIEYLSDQDNDDEVADDEIIEEVEESFEDDIKEEIIDSNVDEEGEETDDSIALYDDSEEDYDDLDDDDDVDHKIKEEVIETEEVDSFINEEGNATVGTGKFVSVATSVPNVCKVGMRKSNLPKTKGEKGQSVTDIVPGTTGEIIASKSDNKCSLCEDHTSESFADLTEHLKIFHHVYDPPRCDRCEEDFDTVQSLNYHLHRKHGPFPERTKYVCDYTNCGKVFVSENGLLGHVNRLHLGVVDTPKEKRYSCDKCEYKCNSMEDIFEHKKVEHDEAIKCDTCNKHFLTYLSLKSHKQLTHNTTSVSCTVCKKMFSNDSYLNKHMKSHFFAGFSCDICNKTVKSKASLKEHLETHKDPSERTYRFMCSYCGKRFALKSNLDDHLNKHTGARPYKCDICLKTFGFRSMLMKHKTFVHSSERPFKCGVCHKGFKFMNLLQNHITTHTNTSKHVCTQCSKTFSTASTLKFHSRKCRGLSWNQPPILPPQQGTLLVFTDPGTSGNIEPVAQAIKTDEQTGIQYNVAMTGDQPLVYTDIDTEDGSPNIQGLETVVEAPKPMEDVEQEEVIAGSAQTSVEVYACSECNSTFSTYKDAETHVLTAHAVSPTPADQTTEMGAGEYHLG